MALEVEQGGPAAAPAEGQDPVKGMVGATLKIAEKIGEVAQLFQQGGAPEGAVAKLAQGKQLVEAAMAEMGGAAPQPQPVNQGNPDTAGAGPTRPADLRG